MSADKTAAQVGDAWDLHRRGNHSEALTAFQRVVEAAPNHIDAHFGLGLTQRALGENSAAATTFQNALRLAEAEKAADDGSRFDRLSITVRMLKQRLAEVGVK
jgi:Tfp pilus assembly protein PilF